MVLRLTHPGRVYWPDAGITKAALAAYYDALANRLLPHIAGRPLALVRCPHGIAESCFFQKHAWEGMPDAVGRTTSRGQELLSIRDREGLRALAQAGALEIHVWGATLARLETPDRLVFDLDPGEGATFADVIAAALEVRERLAQSGLVSFARTTGGKGLHVVVPLAPGAGWAETKGFAAALARDMAARSPERYVATLSKAKRKGRIFVDYLRNGRAQTAIASFSPRARPGAPVAIPLAWGEVAPGLDPARFTIANVGTRLAAQTCDPWVGFFDLHQPLAAAPR
ncbi:MAG: non-homologous end-joining DNA ligase [Alphaproteobacteria bacterium]